MDSNIVGYRPLQFSAAGTTLPAGGEVLFQPAGFSPNNFSIGDCNQLGV